MSPLKLTLAPPLPPLPDPNDSNNLPFLHFEAEPSSMQGRRSSQEDRHLIVKSLKHTCDLLVNKVLMNKVNNYNSERMSKLRDNLPQPSSLFGVFDGHRGQRCSDYIAKKFVLKLLPMMARDGQGEFNGRGGLLEKLRKVMAGNAKRETETDAVTDSQENNLNDLVIIGENLPPKNYTSPQLMTKLFGNSNSNTNGLPDPIHSISISNEKPIHTSILKSFQQLLSDAYLSLDKEFLSKHKTINDGSTSVICLLLGNVLITSWVGDSRAVLRIQNDQNQYQQEDHQYRDFTIPLSLDHKPYYPWERKRIELQDRLQNGKGGKVISNKPVDVISQQQQQQQQSQSGTNGSESQKVEIDLDYTSRLCAYDFEEKSKILLERKKRGHIIDERKLPCALGVSRSFGNTDLKISHSLQSTMSSSTSDLNIMSDENNKVGTNFKNDPVPKEVQANQALKTLSLNPMSMSILNLHSDILHPSDIAQADNSVVNNVTGANSTSKWTTPITGSGGPLIVRPSISIVFNLHTESSLVLCCDGVYDVLTNEEVVQIMSRMKDQVIKKKDAKLMAMGVTQEAYRRESQDNLTCVAVQFSKQFDPRLSISREKVEAAAAVVEHSTVADSDKEAGTANDVEDYDDNKEFILQAQPPDKIEKFESDTVEADKADVNDHAESDRGPDKLTEGQDSDYLNSNPDLKRRKIE